MISLTEAMAAHRSGDLPVAERLYRAALAFDPDNSRALALLGTLKGQQKIYDEALTHLDRCVTLDPQNAQAHNSRGNVLRWLARYEDALSAYDRAIALMPLFAGAYANKGLLLQDFNRHEEALFYFDKALQLSPFDAATICSRGPSLEGLGRVDEALASYARALALNPQHADAYQLRLNLLNDLDRRDEALADYERLLRLDPQRPYFAGGHLAQKLDLCLWHDFHEHCEAVRRAVDAEAKVCAPFNLLKLPATAGQQRKCAEIYVQHKYKPAAVALWRGERYRHDRIRLGYFSSDFRNHATSFLMAGLLDEHDHSRFEVFGFHFGPPRQDEMRDRLTKAFDHFIDLANEPDASAAARVRDLEIDIAVDLKGFTYDARPALFAAKPAPIQVNYLGFPATMGAPYMDYIVADRVVIPRECEAFYSEKVVVLPHSYQANDRKRHIPEVAPSRSEAGLPEKGFVFACFNNAFKITPDVWDVWMRLLRGVEGSVLWLLDVHPSASRNLRREAQSRGVVPERLIFAPRQPLAEHLARHRCADLFLDTFHCNAHTTASDALWAGLPVLTCIGATFASRVAASLLTAIGLPELIANSPVEYEAMARQFATNDAMLRAIRAKLASNRLTHPLFDTARFTRDLEAAYRIMWQRHENGEAPDRIEIAAS